MNVNELAITIGLGLVLGVVSGVLASYLFLTYYLKNKVPDIKIAPNISKIIFKGETNYFFKFINATNSEIFDIRVEATLYKPVGQVGGIDLQGKDINLKDNFFSYLSKDDPNDIRNLHALRVRTTDDVSTNWDDESSFIRLKIMARHSLSGLNQIFVKDYLTKDLIVDKKFKQGNDLGVHNT